MVTRSTLPLQQAHRLNQATGGLEGQTRLRLLHGKDACFEKNCGHAHAVGPRHGGGVLGFHDDKAHLSGRVFGRDQQIDMPENTAPRLVEHEVAQGLVPGNPA